MANDKNKTFFHGDAMNVIFPLMFSRKSKNCIVTKACSYIIMPSYQRFSFLLLIATKEYSICLLSPPIVEQIILSGMMIVIVWRNIGNILTLSTDQA